MTRFEPFVASVCLALFINGCVTSEDPAPAPGPAATDTANNLAPAGLTSTTGPSSPTAGGTSGATGIGPAPVGSTAAPAPVRPGPTNTTTVSPPGPVSPTVDPVNPGPTPDGTAPPDSTTTPVDPPPVEPQPTLVDLPSLVVSSSDAMWSEGEVEVVTAGTPNFTVNSAETYQTWLGFGGTFNEKGWTALSELSPADRETAMKLLFSKAEGAAFTWGRIPVGASDYADSRYSLNDTADDYAMANFSLARDEMKLIPYIKAAQAVKSDIKFWASPWSPPGWMKIDPRPGASLSPHASDTGWMRSDEQTLNAYALYFVKFVQGYAEHGIPMDHIQPQNEPGWQQAYPTCGWGQSDLYSASGNQRITNTSAAKLSTFVKDYLKPAFGTAGLDTKVWMGTLSNGALFDFHMEGITPDLVEGVGLQWSTQAEVGALASQGYLVMQSEHKCGNYPFGTSSDYVTHKQNQSPTELAPNDFNYGQETWDLIKGWIQDGVNIYSAWNMVLDQHGTNLDEVRVWNQNALLVADTSSKQLKPTPAYYVFRHLSQFIEPQAKRVNISGDALAFKNPDGSVAAVVRTTTAGNQIVSIDGTLLQFAATGNGWATVYWEP